MKFRVLSLSGGGVRGLYTASFLAHVEELTKKRIVDHFDLIVGTSTGGLIALAMSLGHDVTTVRDFYAEKGELLFPKKCRWGFWRPKHSIDDLISEIKTRIGDTRTLGEAKKPVVITTFDAVKGQPVCFKTRHHEDFRNDHRRYAWEIAIATAAAPIYYGAFQAPGGGDYIDGGVWANCPVLVGVVEAIDRFNQSRTNIDVLSVGTTRCPFQVPRNVRRAGAWRYLSIRKRPLINLMMEANRCAAMFMAERLIGKKAIYEVDRDLPKGIALDDASATARRELQDLGTEDAKDNASVVEERFLRDRADDWSPVP